MKRLSIIASFLAFSAMVAFPVHAQNPVGSIDSASCASISGWSYDPSAASAPVLGCTDPSATNYNPGATQDNGSCSYPPTQCVSRYRWVNAPGGADQAAVCASAGAVSVASSPRGICASGEDRPISGYGYNSIYYSHGQWGGGNGGGGSIVRLSRDDYRCYMDGQGKDEDATDIAVAYFCDFGDAYSASCPADEPSAPSGGGGGGGGGGGTNERVLLNFAPTGFFDFFASLFKVFPVFAASSDSNAVLIYDGPTLLAEVPADIYRPDVNAVYGVSGNHGFSWAIPQSLKDGASHTIYVYGKDIDGDGSNVNLGNSPQVLSCSQAAGNFAPTSPSLSCPSNGSFTNTSLSVSFNSSDADGNGVHYLIDWDANGTTDQIVPSSGFAPSGSGQVASRSWSSPGTKTINLSAEDDQGALSSVASCSFSLVDQPGNVTPECSDTIDNDGDGKVDFPDDLGCTSASDGTENSDSPACTVNCGEAGNGGGGGGNGGSGGSGGGSQTAGFTISGDKNKVQIQFLGSLSGTSDIMHIEANSFGGFSGRVTLRLVSVLSTASGASLPAGTTATASFDGKPFTTSPTTVQTYDGNLGRYRGEQGLIGSTFRITLSKAITESYIATIEGRSGSDTALFYLTLDPKPTAPSFNEI